MTQFSLFAIRQKSTGHFLPERRGRGHSASVPVACDGTQDKRIRLFHTRKSAQMALTAWLQGEWVRGEQRGSWPDEEYDEKITIEKREDRKADDMEIITYIVIEKAILEISVLLAAEKRIEGPSFLPIPEAAIKLLEGKSVCTGEQFQNATPEDAGKLLRGEIS